MPGALIAAPFTYFTDDEGAPLVGGQIEFYITGTDVHAPVYHDSTLMDAWTEPIIVPADGKVVIYQPTDSLLKMIVKDADGNVLMTVDPIAPTAGASGSGATSAAFTFGGDDFFPVTATAIPSGTTVAVIHPGSSFFTEDSANLVGTYTLQGMMQAGTGETITAALVNLSQGSPDTAIVSMTSTDTAGELKVSGTITFAASGTARTYAVKTYVASGTPSYAWSFQLMRS